MGYNNYNNQSYGRNIVPQRRTGQITPYNRSTPSNNQSHTYHNVKKSNPIEDKNNVVCYKCNNKGHYSSNCPRKSEVGNNHDKKSNKVKIYHLQADPLQLVRVSGHIDNKQCMFTLDTGANQSVLSVDYADKWGIQYQNCDVVIRVADHFNEPKVASITAPLNVDVHGNRIHLQFLVYSLPKSLQCLLGLDWFKKAKAVIDTVDHVLRFKEREICLTDQHQEILPTNSDCYSAYAETPTTEEELLEEQAWDDQITVDQVVFKDLDTETAYSVREFINKNKDMFASNYLELGCVTMTAFEIQPTTRTPIYQHYYRKSIKEREDIKTEVAKMLEAKIIRPSRSPWSSPVIMVHKKGRQDRFCIDFKKLNAVTPQDKFPLQRIDDIFDRLAGSEWFTGLDLKCGYWQIPMQEQSIPLTGFTTPDGHYECLRMPFGLKNAPAEFCRMMFQLLGDLQFVQIYLDDITIHSKTIKEHLDHIQVVFDRLREANVRINLKKCTWCQKEVKILGFLVSKEGTRLDPEKISAIVEMKPPRYVKEVQQTMGIFNYYREYIQDFAKISGPIYRLLRKDIEWEWTHDCQIAFEFLKTKLIAEPILRHPNFELSFIVYTDASNLAIGAILAQMDNKKEYVVSYASRSLKHEECNYGVTEKECLAVLWAIKHFRIYLYGKRFTVITDHVALHWLMNISEPTGRLARWSILLQTYEFDIIHRAGRIHQNVDTLSRPILAVITRRMKKIEDSNESHPKVNTSPIQDEEITAADLDAEEDLPMTDESRETYRGLELPAIGPKALDPYEDEALIYFLRHGRHLPGVSKKQAKRVNALYNLYTLEKQQNGSWELKFHPSGKDGYKHVLVPQRQDRQLIVERAHLLGHFQVETVLSRLLETYFWPKMRKDVEIVVKNCIVCKRHQPQRITEHPARALPIMELFQRIGIDLILGLPETTHGHVGMLVITEYLSKYPFVYPIKSKTAVEQATKLFNYISIFGAPKEILSDQGREFLNKVVDEMSKICGVERKVTSPYHPRTNGLTERFNQTLVIMLKKLTEDDPKRWDEWLPYALLSYRTRINSTTKLTPFELVFGRPMNGFVAWPSRQIVNLDDNTIANSIQTRAVEIKRLYSVLHPDTVERIKKTQEVQKQIQNNRTKPIDNILEYGSSVYVRNMHIRNKLAAYAHGCYTVVGRSSNGNYILTNRLGRKMKQTYPLSRLVTVTPDEPIPKDLYLMEKIVDHRRRRGQLEYFVKWKDFSESENSWVREAEFDDTDIINEYWAHAAAPAEIEEINNETTAYYIEREVQHRSNQQHTSPQVLTPWSWASIFILLSLLNFFPTTYAAMMIAQGVSTNALQPITGNFWSCNHDNMKVVGPPHCTMNKVDGEITKWYVLHKQDHAIEGDIVFCEVMEVTITLTDNWIGRDTKERTIKHIMVTPHDCQMMVQTKTCYGVPMSCIGNTCSFEPEPEPTWRLWRTVEETKRQCRFKKHRQTAELPTDIIAYGKHGACLAKDPFCFMETGVSIWTLKEETECPYELVTELWFYHHNDILVTHESITPFRNGTRSPTQMSLEGLASDHQLSNVSHLLFQLISETQTCIGPYAHKLPLGTPIQKKPTDPITVQQTKQGLFLTRDSRARAFRPAITSASLIEQLSLADGDFTSYLRHDQILKNAQVIWITHCKQLEQDMQVYKLFQNKYFIFKDVNQKDTVLYADRGMLYQPDCKKENQVVPIDGLNNCYEDLPIKVNGQTRFLKQDVFITETTRTIDCLTLNKQYFINQSLIIQQKGRNVIYTALSKTNMFRPTPYQYEHEETNFNHHPILTSNFDPIGERLDKISVMDNGNKFELFPDPLAKQNNSWEVYGNQVTQGWVSFTHTLTKWVFIMLSLIISVIIIVYMIRYRRGHYSLTQDVETLMRKFAWVTGINRAPTTTAQPVSMRMTDEEVRLPLQNN